MKGTIDKAKFIKILAGFFLLLLMFEFVSHGAICRAGYHHSTDASVTAKDSGHEDPCATMILCSDSKRQDDLSPVRGHDAGSHNALFAQLFTKTVEAPVIKQGVKPLYDAQDLFRPPDPLFHPPEPTA